MDPLDEFPSVDYNRSTDPKIVQMWKALETKWKIAIAILIILAIIIVIALVALAIRIFFFSSSNSGDDNNSSQMNETTGYIPPTPVPTGDIDNLTPTPDISVVPSPPPPSPSLEPSPTALQESPSPKASASPSPSPSPSPSAEATHTPSPSPPAYYYYNQPSVNVPSTFTSTIQFSISLNTEADDYYYGYYKRDVRDDEDDDDTFVILTGAGTLASDNQFNKTKLALDLIIPFIGTLQTLENVFLDGSSYSVTQQQCYPSDDQDFVDIFEWIQFATPAADHVTVNGIDCVVYEFDFMMFEVALYVDSTTLDKPTQTPIRFLIDMVGLSYTFDFTSFIPNIAGLEDLQIPEACSFTPICDQGEVITQYVFLENSPFDENELSSRNAYDRAGLAFDLCYEIIGTKLNISETIYSRFATNVDSTWGQYSHCDTFLGCQDGSLDYVGRRITKGYSDDDLLGQCSAESIIGFEFSFPNTTQCGENDSIGANGCTWRATLEKTISGSCLLSKGIQGTCANDHAAGTNDYSETIGLLEDAFSGSSECPDISQYYQGDQKRNVPKERPSSVPYPLIDQLLKLF